MFDTRFIGFIGSQLHTVVYLGGSLSLAVPNQTTFWVARDDASQRLLCFRY